MEYKLCTKCGELKPMEGFHKNKMSNDGRASNCIECYKKYYQENKEKIQKRARKYYQKHKTEMLTRSGKHYRKKKLRKFEMTVTDGENIFLKQKSMCAICGKNLKSFSNAYIDHNHKNMKFRGFLCGICNSLLGFVKDNPLILIKAANYLRKKGF